MTGCLPRTRRLALVGLLALFLVLATLYNAISTPFEAPDEIGHFYYVVHLLQTGQLPVVPAVGPPPNYEHEGIQPPLYYGSASVFVRALSGILALDLEDAGAPLDVNPHSTCAQPGARYNVNYFERDAHNNRFPYQGRVRVLHVLRVWSSLLALATVAGVYATTLLAFPESPWSAWLAAGIAAFTPGFLFTAGAVRNDNLVTALATWGLYLVMLILRDGIRWPQALALGILAGLATLSKASGALLLPMSLLAILVIWLSQPRLPSSRRLAKELPSLIGYGCLVLLPFLAIAGWWVYRNWTLYGDLTGTRPMLEALPLRQQVSVWLLIREIPGVFMSWWGVFACTAPPPGFYLPYLLLCLVALAGTIAARQRLWRRWPQVIALAAWLVAVFAAYLYWNLTIHAPKGRLLYPAMVSVAVLLGRGLGYWAERRAGLGVVFLVLLCLGAIAGPFAVMAPPVRLPEIHSSPADVDVGHPFDGRFGEDIALLGYDLDATSFEPGDELDVTLYWHVLAQPPDHYTLAIQLVSAEPGDTATLVNFNTWTGGGTYPTGNWHPGDVIVDNYQLDIPEDVARAQGWVVRAILFDGTSGARLPFTVGGQPGGDGATLGLVRVGASDEATLLPQGDNRLDPPVVFGEAVALEGVDMARSQGNLHVTLWWRSLAQLGQDYIVFVHVYDANRDLVATADGPPLGGGFPSSLWEPGDRVLDERVVPLSEGTEGPLAVGVGWYDPVTGDRLGATGADGWPLPDDTFIIPLP